MNNAKYPMFYQEVAEIQETLEMARYYKNYDLINELETKLAKLHRAAEAVGHFVVRGK